MRFIPFLCCLAATGIGLVQAAGLTVQTLDIQGKNSRGEPYAKGQMTLPVIKVTPSNTPMATGPADEAANSKIAKKINARLAMIDTFGSERQQFTISRQDTRLLTLAFDSEGCGAYCENYSTWYSFDLQDGSMLTAANLLTPQGMRTLAARLRQTQMTRYRQQLATLAKERAAALARRQAPAARSGQPMPDDTSDIDDRIALNQSCLQDQLDQAAKAKEPANAQTATPFQHNDFIPFEITATAFKITAGRCSNHAMRALDDVGDVTLSLPLPELAPWLTAYGRAVLLNDGNALPAERLYSQVLLGTLGGNTAISMLLEKGPSNGMNNISGSYFYDRFRTPIVLSGTQAGQTLRLTEVTEAKPGQPEKTATFRLNQSGNELHGQWTSQATGKMFEVRLAP